MRVEIDIYLCMEPNKVVYPIFNHNGFNGIKTHSLSDVQKLKSITSKEYYEIESMVDSGSAIINGVNECTIYSGNQKDIYADSKTLYKVPKEAFEEFHKLVNGTGRPTIYEYIYKYTIKLDERVYSGTLGEFNIHDIIKRISEKQNKSLPTYRKENSNQTKENLNSFMSAINAMIGD